MNEPKEEIWMAVDDKTVCIDIRINFIIQVMQTF